MSIMMVQVDVMCCQSVGTDLSMMDIDDLMTEICHLKKEVKLLETKLRERDELNRKDVSGVSACGQTSSDLQHSICNEEQKTSEKLLGRDMGLKKQIKEEQTVEDYIMRSDLTEVKKEIPESGQHGENTDSMYSDVSLPFMVTLDPKKESSLPNISQEENSFMAGEESVNCSRAKKNCPRNAYHICSQCGKVFTYKSKLLRHMRIHTAERPYKCDHCEISFTHKSKLEMHMRIHTGEQPHKCEQCGKAFSRKTHFNDHMRVHTGEEPYKCETCGKVCNRKDHLKSHMRVHTGEKPYRCETCGKIYSRKDRLNNHMRVHSEENPFTCEQCGKIFSRKDHFNDHMRIHTADKPFRCGQCGKSFTLAVTLRGHLLDHSGVKSFQCKRCSKTFITSFALKQHMKTHANVKQVLESSST